jgi:hypothetical protein
VGDANHTGLPPVTFALLTIPRMSGKVMLPVPAHGYAMLAALLTIPRGSLTSSPRMSPAVWQGFIMSLVRFQETGQTAYPGDGKSKSSLRLLRMGRLVSGLPGHGINMRYGTEDFKKVSHSFNEVLDWVSTRPSEFKL